MNWVLVMALFTRVYGGNVVEVETLHFETGVLCEEAKRALSAQHEGASKIRGAEYICLKVKDE